MATNFETKKKMRLLLYSILPTIALASSFYWEGNLHESIDSKFTKLGNHTFSEDGYQVRIVTKYAEPDYVWSQPITFGIYRSTFTCKSGKNHWWQSAKEYKFGEFEWVPTPSSDVRYVPDLQPVSTIEFAYDDLGMIVMRLQSSCIGCGSPGRLSVRGSIIRSHRHGASIELKKNEILDFTLTFKPTYMEFTGTREDGSPLYVNRFGNSTHKIYYDGQTNWRSPDASDNFSVANPPDNPNSFWRPLSETLDLFTGPAVTHYFKNKCAYEFKRYAGDLLMLEINNLNDLYSENKQTEEDNIRELTDEEKEFFENWNSREFYEYPEPKEFDFENY